MNGEESNTMHLVWNGPENRINPTTVAPSKNRPLITKQYQGSCHCGKVNFVITPSERETSLLDCNCSMCAMKGILHITVPKSRVIISSLSTQNLTTYTYNTGVAQHTFCKTCGIHPFYTPRSNPDCYAVNARCLVDYDLTDAYIEPFEGKNFSGNLDIKP